MMELMIDTIAKLWKDISRRLMYMIQHVQDKFEYLKGGKSPNKDFTTKKNFLWLLQWCYNQPNLKNNETRVHIDTLDNPGWAITINLKESSMEDKSLEDVTIDNSEHDWLRCYLRDGKFEGPGGNFNLFHVLEIFRAWTKNSKIEEELDFQIEEDFLWLQKWYISYCNGDWEKHGCGVHLKSIDNRTWNLTIGLFDTQLEDQEFNEIKSHISDRNWLHCYVKNYKFEAYCSVFNISDVLKIFRKFSERCEETSIKESTIIHNYPCPCCSYLTLSMPPPGTFEICPVCNWEDDNIQFNNWDFEGGANEVSLERPKKILKNLEHH